MELGESKVKLEDIVSHFLKDIFIEDGNIIGYFDDPETFSLIVQQMKEKGYSYCIRDSDVRKKLKSNQGIANEDLRSEFSQHSVFFQLKAMSIKFFGLPFTVEKTTHYQCAFGRKYYKTRSEQGKGKCGDNSTLPMKKRKKIISKKMGCLARMTLKKIIVYPEYKLDAGSDWRKKKYKIECLRRDLSDKDKLVETFSRYYLSVSLQSSHNHPPSSIMQVMNKPKKAQKRTLKNERKQTEEIQNMEVKTICWDASFPSASISEQEDPPDSEATAIQNQNFLSTLVKFPGDTYDSEMKPIAIGLEINGFEQPEDARTFQIQTIQFHPPTQDLQVLFRDRLKRLYTLSESCFNSALLVRLVEDLEQIEIALRNDVGYDPNVL